MCASQVLAELGTTGSCAEGSGWLNRRVVTVWRLIATCRSAALRASCSPRNDRFAFPLNRAHKWAPVSPREKGFTGQAWTVIGLGQVGNASVSLAVVEFISCVRI